MPRRFALLAVVLAFLAGCQAASGPARPAGGHVVGSVFAIELPIPWAVELVELPTLIAWTQEPGGYTSQLLFVTGVPPGGTYAPFSGAPAFFPEMTSREIAQMTLNSHVQYGGHTDAAIDEVEEIRFADRPGFRFTFGYVTRANHEVRSEYHGTVVGDRLYMIGFSARAAVFAAQWPDVERIMASARLLPDGRAAACPG